MNVDIITFFVLIIVIVLLCVLLKGLMKQHAEERKQLLNRIMAKDYHEFAAFELEKKKLEPDVKKATLNDLLEREKDHILVD